MTAGQSAIRSRAAPLLLAGALSLFGAKLPLPFALWTVAAICFVLWELRRAPDQTVQAIMAWPSVAILLIVLSIVASVDRSVSLFRGSQLLTYVLFWCGLRLHFERNPTSMDEISLWILGLGILTATVTSIQFVLLRHIPERLPPPGLLPINPSFNTVWMASVATFLIATVVQRWRSIKSASFDWRLGVQGGLALLLIALLIPGRTSRTGIVALAAGLGLIAFARLRMKQIAMGILLLAALLLLIPKSVLVSRFRLADQDAKRWDRLSFWTVAIQATRQRPWGGWGPGNFELAYQRNAFPVREDPTRFGRTTQFAHNEFLQVFAELGVFAGLFFLAGFLLLVVRCRPLLTTDRLPAVVVLFSLALSAIWNPTFHMPFLTMVFVVLASWLMPLPIKPSLGRSTIWSLRTGLWALSASVLLSTAWSALRDHWARSEKWSRILKVDARDATAWHYQGLAETTPGTAIHSHMEAVRWSPHNAYFWEALGLRLESTSKPEHLRRALDAYTRVQMLAPSRATAYLAAGRILYQSGRFNDASAAFEQASKLEPRYWEAHLWAARCLAALGQRREARERLHRLRADYQQFAEWAKTAKPHLSSYEARLLAYNDRIVTSELYRLP